MTRCTATHPGAPRVRCDLPQGHAGQHVSKSVVRGQTGVIRWPVKRGPDA